MTHGVAAACLGGLLAIGTAFPASVTTGPAFPGGPEVPGVAAQHAADPGGSAPIAVGGVPAPAGRRDADRGASHPASVPEVNRATEEELRALPGVGPVLAARIVSSREVDGPFRRPEDLLRVGGIGPKRLARLQAHLRWPEQP